MKKKLGFTLVEILVVVAIIAVLSVTAFVGYEKAKAKSRDARRISDMSVYRDGLALYKNENKIYPNGNYGSTANFHFITTDSSMNLLVTGGYIPSLPRDPLCDPLEFCEGYSRGYKWFYMGANSYCGNGVCLGDLVLHNFKLENPLSTYSNIYSFHTSPENVGFGICLDPAGHNSSDPNYYQAQHEFCQILKK